ncbi:hypothetical protein P8452_41453 [Trifolium repens]|nr:hypothetical protein P8452_41453 [Trifolium repens]
MVEKLTKALNTFFLLCFIQEYLVCFCNSPIQPTSVTMKRKKDSTSDARDVVKGDNIEVLNIHSRCAKFKLHEENEALLLSQLNDEDLETFAILRSNQQVLP